MSFEQFVGKGVRDASQVRQGQTFFAGLRTQPLSALLWLGLLIAVEVPAKTESFSADSLPNALSSPAQVSSSVSVQPASFSQATLSPATLSPAAPSPSAVEWSALLDATGVSEVLEQANGLIGQEVSNLEKTPLGFTPDELAALQMNFQFRLGSDRLKQDVMDRLQQQLPAEQALQLQNILQSPRVRFLQTLQQQLNDDAVRQAMRTYRVQVQESTPNADRMELLTTLDETLGQSALEADLKVELRKQLLVTVSQLKSQESIPETMLDDQLRHYRQDVEQQISKNALHAYLYLFKRTPSTQVQDLIQSFDQPAFDNFMSICQAALLDSFRSARAQLQQDMRLANH